MTSTLKSERGKGHAEYIKLRLKILDHYGLLPLVGREAGARAHKLPPKLGHWDPGSNGHSERVLDACPELESVVRAIEELLKKRSPDYIKAHHVGMRRGDNFRRRGNPKNQINPGEWPPKYK
jgi:hypothetical protein